MPPAPDELSSPLDASSDAASPLLDVEASPPLPLALPPDDVDDGGVFNPAPPLEVLPPLDEDPLLDEEPLLEELLLFNGVLGICWKVGAFDDPHAATTAARHTPKSIT